MSKKVMREADPEFNLEKALEAKISGISSAPEVTIYGRDGEQYIYTKPNIGHALHWRHNENSVSNALVMHEGLNKLAKAVKIKYSENGVIVSEYIENLAQPLYYASSSPLDYSGEQVPIAGEHAFTSDSV